MSVNRLRALASGLPPHKRGRRRLVIFQAFIDDSGSGKPAFVLSGYISPVRWWEDFSYDWQRLLDQQPKLEYFKMREAANLSEQFGGMKMEARDKRVQQFTSLIRVAAHASIISVIPIRLFESIVKTNAPQKEFRDPYFVALFDIVMKLLINQAAVDSSDTIEFIFDDNPRLAAKVPHYYQLTRSMLSPELRRLIAASPRFEDDKDFLPLQAGDLQSWYFRRLFAEKIAKEPFHKHVQKSLFAELDRVPSLMSLWTREKCEHFVGHHVEEPKTIPEVRDIHALLEQIELS